jgi:hypothetical protein
MITIDGGCHCGRIRFQAEVDPERVALCHCDDCQALTGTAFRTTVATTRDKLQIQGETKVYVKVGDSGRRRFQHFCPDCGSHLFVHGEGETADAWGIRWGGVSQRDQLAPKRQMWRRSAAPWVCDFADAPALMTE